jgi:hypothetical protein
MPQPGRARSVPGGEGEEAMTATTTNEPEVRTTRPRQHPSVDERAARGRAARAESPRRSHADRGPAAGRRDPVDVLGEQAATRVPRAGADPLRAHALVAWDVKRFAAGFAIAARSRGRRMPSGGPCS